MSRKQPSGLTRLFRRVIGQLLTGRSQKKDCNSKRPLNFESLEGRQLLAADLASLTGVVSLNSPVVGAAVNLYVDDGDGIFEPNTDDGAPTVDTTDGSGVYRFDRLQAGDYWLEQPAQSVGTIDLGQFVHPLITITAGHAAGVAGTVIDDFGDTPPATITADGTTNPNSLAADYAGALGGERDMTVALTGGTTVPTVTLTSSGNQLLFDSSFDATGDFGAIYDGNDDNATTLAATGLGSVDLTNSGADVAVKVRVQADHATATVRLRVYTDATNFSDSAPFSIPGTNTATDAVFYFADFAAGTGAAGAADFTDVGAIDLLIQTTVGGTDGLVTVLGGFGQTVITQNIDNQADLSLDKNVDNPTPNFGQDVTFTLTLSNPAGGAGATNVKVTDLLPAGLAFVSSTPSQGAYTSGTGLWDVGSLAAGGTATLQIVATVGSTAQLTNTATISAADQPDPDLANNSDSQIVDAPPAADLSLDKIVDNAAPLHNQNVTFTLTLTNDGPDDATGVEVTDLLPAGLTFVSANPSTGSYDDSTGVWTVGTLANGAGATLEIVATATTTSTVTNAAEVTAVNEFDPDSTPNNGAAEDDRDTIDVTAVPVADLSLTKDIDDPTPNFAQDVTFTLTLSNNGPDDAPNVVVTDLLPAGLTFVSATPSTGAYDDTTGLWTIASLANSGNATLAIVATVNSTAPVINAAEVTASGAADPDSTPNDGAGDDFDSITIDAPPAADLSLDKIVDNAAPLHNQNVTFTLTLTNDGPDDATGVEVTDLLPAGLTFVSANPSTGSYDDSSGVWTVGTLANGAGATLEIVATATTTSTVTNAAEVTAVNEFDPDSTPNNGAAEDDRDTIDVTAVPVADLSLTKDIDDPTPNFGQDVTFTLTLSNSGPDDAPNVVVTDLLPAGLTFVSATPSTGAYDDTTGLWTIASLANSGNATLAIVATVNSTAPVINAAEVTASGAADSDSTPNDGAGDDFDSITIDAPPAADLSLTKDVSNPTPNQNANVTFTLTLTNGGPDQATGVVVTDLLPAGLAFVSSTPSQGTYTGGTGVWDVGTVNSSGTATLQIVAAVNSLSPIDNVAEVTASDQFDPDSTPNDGTGDDRASITVDAVAADLSLAKQASTTTPNVGQNVTFTLTLTNSGPDAATGVAVTDLLPAGLSFVSSTPSQGTYTSGTGVWDVGTVNASGTATLQIVATVTSSAAIINSAEVTASAVIDPDSTPGDGTGDDFATVTIDAPPAADLSLTNTPSSATPNFGTNVTFTVTVSNAGPDQGTGVVVTDLLPAGLVFVSSTQSQGSYVSATGVWTVGSINNGANATLTIVARVNSTAPINNVAEVTASGTFDPDSTPNDGTGDDRAVASIDAPSAADLRLAKSSSSAFVNVGQNVTYTVTVNNDGPDQATNVAVTDLLPAGLAFVSSSPSQGTYDSGTGIWSVGTLNNGASATLQIVATLTTAGSKTNTAQVTASDQFDPDSTPNDNTGDDRATATVTSTLLSKRRFLARPH